MKVRHIFNYYRQEFGMGPPHFLITPKIVLCAPFLVIVLIFYFLSGMLYSFKLSHFLYYSIY